MAQMCSHHQWRAAMRVALIEVGTVSGQLLDARGVSVGGGFQQPLITCLCHFARGDLGGDAALIEHQRNCQHRNDHP